MWPPRPSDLGHAEQQLARDQVGAQLGQVALAHVAAAAVDDVGDGQADDRIAQKLQPFVVQAVVAPALVVGLVGQGGAQQFAVLVAVSQFFSRSSIQRTFMTTKVRSSALAWPAAESDGPRQELLLDIQGGEIGIVDQHLLQLADAQHFFLGIHDLRKAVGKEKQDIAARRRAGAVPRCLLP